MPTGIRTPQVAAPLLEVHGLRTVFQTDAGTVKAVDGVDLEVRRGEVLGLVGESGCGKSVTSLSILRLIGPPGEILDGSITFEGKDLLALPERDLSKIRGSRIGMIFQQPLSSLNPVFRVGDQISEVLRIHEGLGRSAARDRARELLEMVGLPDPDQIGRAYPHELSGGQAQRVMIAISLACSPALLIADEPTTALDVTIQAQILDLLRVLRMRTETSVILITHDLGVIAEIADRVAVMYAGRIVEQASLNSLFARPRHPYTQGLIGSVPVLGEVKGRLAVIPGAVPDLIDVPPGCRFAPRCEARQAHGLAICETREPELLPLEGSHLVRCWLYQSAEGHQPPLVEA